MQREGRMSLALEETVVDGAARMISPARRRYWIGIALVAPVVLFLAAFFLWPVMQMIALSVSAKTVNGLTVHGLTFDNYIRLVSSDLYFRILLRTLRLALMASFVSILIAYPLAIAVARGGPTMARIVTMSVVAPLLVNVVVRAYGWQAILNKAGALAYVLKLVGVAQPPSLLYTEWAVLIACVHVYLPFMVMPLATAISRIKPSTEEAARIAGASPAMVFLRVTCPLSLPGLAVGVSLVFSLTAAAYVTPQILGGNFSPLLGTLIEQQMLTLNDWPFAAAISTLLIAIVLTANIVFLRIVNRRFSRWTAKVEGA
jgi:putative spermidine/putrescine transport system permease protein